MKETDLYPPLKTWLEAQGYVVRGEVGRCDLAAEKGRVHAPLGGPGSSG